MRFDLIFHMVHYGVQKGWCFLIYGCVIHKTEKMSNRLSLWIYGDPAKRIA